MDGHRFQRAPIRVIRVELQVPFRRGPVGDAEDGFEWKGIIGARRTVGGGLNRVHLALRFTGQMLRVPAAKRGAKGDFFVWLPQESEVIAHVPAIAREPEQIVVGSRSESLLQVN